MKTLTCLVLSFASLNCLGDRKARAAFSTNYSWCLSPQKCVQACQINYPQDAANVGPIHIKITPYLANTSVNYHALDSTKTKAPVQEYHLSPGDSINVAYGNWSGAIAGPVKEIEVTVVGNNGFLYGECVDYFYGNGIVTKATLLNGGRPF